MLSKHVYESWGKEIAKKVEAMLPEGSVILEQHPNFDRAGLDMLIYNEKFNLVGLGQKVPREILDIGINTEAPKPKLIYNH